MLGAAEAILLGLNVRSAALRSRVSKVIYPIRAGPPCRYPAIAIEIYLFMSLAGGRDLATRTECGSESDNAAAPISIDAARESPRRPENHSNHAARKPGGKLMVEVSR